MAQQSLLLQKVKKSERSRKGGYVVERNIIATRGFRGQMSPRNNSFVTGDKKHTQQEGKEDYFCQQLLGSRPAIGLELSIGQTSYDISFFHPGNKTWQILCVPVCASFDSGDRSVQRHKSSHSSTSSS